MNIGRSMLLLVLIPFLAACGAAEANAPCSDLNVREAALTSLGARMVASALGDNTWDAHVRDDRYVVPIPRQYRRVVGMDSVVVHYSFDGNNDLVLTWPAETGFPDIHYSMTDLRKLSRPAVDRVASCEGNLVISSPGEFIRTEAVSYHIELLDDGHLSVFGQAGETTFRSSRVAEDASHVDQAAARPLPATPQPAPVDTPTAGW